MPTHHWEEALDREIQAIPYFCVRQRGGRLETEGNPECVVGHGTQSDDGADTDPFASWHWDGRRLTVRNDRYGFYSMFYWNGDGEFAISPSPVKLLVEGAPKELNFGAIGTLFRFRFLVGEETPFAAIKVAPPDATMYWEGGDLKVSGRYHLQPPQEMSRETAVDGFIELFREAMRRRPPDGEVAVPLSGGRDSRHIFLELCDRGTPPAAAITIRYWPRVVTEDVDVAGQLTVRTGVKHEVLDVPRKVVPLECRNHIQTHFCTLQHSWLLPLEDHLRGRYGTVYEGVAGDLLATSVYNSDALQAQLEAGNLHAIADRFLIEPEWMVHALPAKVYREASREAARERVVAELRRHLSAANPIGSLLFYNRARRVTALSPTTILGRAAKVWCPYLDRDLYDFMAGVPVRLLLDPEYHKFHSDAIQRAYPKYADIPFAGKKPSYQRDLELDELTLPALTDYVLSHAKSRLLRRSYIYPRLLQRRLWRPARVGTTGMANFCLYLLHLEKYL